MIPLTAVLAFVAFPQDPDTLESVLERMDAAAIESRGARAVVRSAGDYAAGEVAVARDGTVRLRADGGANEFTLSPEALYLTHRESGPIRHSGWHGLRVVNERLVSSTAGPHNPLEYQWEGMLLRALAPRAALAFEPNLRLAGRRRLEGQEYYLLFSRPRLVRWVGPVN